jgi:hypothetical protein
LAITGVLGASWYGWSRLGILEGQVVGPDGPLAGARVRYHGVVEGTSTDASGRFRLAVRDNSKAVTATKENHTIAAAVASRSMVLEVARAPNTDDVHYAWIDPDPDPAQPKQCGNCHGDIYHAWDASAHARSAVNPRFLDMIAPRNGRSSWNLRDEHPDGIGVCAKCHAPTFAPPDFDYDPHRAAGTAAKGVHCDLCHKTADVPTDKLGTRFGIDGLDLRRPGDERQLFFGPLEDAVRAGETFVYAPVYRESRYCASCHEGVVFGVHAYGTFSEWKESFAASQGRTCQSCHMASNGSLTNIAPGKGGVERDPRSLSSHAMPGATAAMLKKCLALSVRTDRVNATWRVTTEITTRDVGHRVPTGFIDRHLVLVLEAVDASGVPVVPIEGSRLPAAAGTEMSGRAGKLYAKMLVDSAGKGPVPFWMPAEKAIDSRLFPDDADRATFVWPANAATVRVRLIHRRLWPHVAKDRGNETLVHEQTLELK